jgi:manganese/zinc/iron transport system permease protein
VNWTELDTWIVVTAMLTAMACAIPGVFLLLNKQSMLGDAISHAVLPGLAIAFLVSGTRDTLPMLIGAVSAGLLTGLLSGVIQRRGRVESGAALGVVFCGLFALGLVLIRTAANRVDLDPSCVLYGSLELAVIDVRTPPRIVWQSAGALALNLSLALFFFKELRMAAFDGRFATANGFSDAILKQGLTIITAVTAVLAFESVGSILVIAMLIVPGASALLICRSVQGILAMALVFACASALLGHVLAISLAPLIIGKITNQPEIGALSSPGMIAATAGLIFFILLALVNAVRSRNKEAASDAREGGSFSSTPPILPVEWRP